MSVAATWVSLEHGCSLDMTDAGTYIGVAGTWVSLELGCSLDMSDAGTLVSLGHGWELLRSTIKKRSLLEHRISCDKSFTGSWSLIVYVTCYDNIDLPGHIPR